MSKPVDPKRTPLHGCHVEAGAKMVSFAGWEMPIQYSGVLEEHGAVRTAAGLFDVSHMGEILIEGVEALSFLQWLTPNDVSKLSPGRAHYSALLSEAGTYLDDLLVYRLSAEQFLLVVNAAKTEDDLRWIQSHAPREGVRVEDQSPRTALLALQGPRAETILAKVTATDLAKMRYYGFSYGEVDGIRTLISRTGYTGEDGFELYVEPEAAAGLWRRLLEVGAAEGLLAIGLGARDTLRLEAGLLLSGQDMDENTTPLEVGLGWVVKLGKGEFLGREALVAQKSAGLARKLVGFELTGRGIARHGHRVVAAGGECGVVTSGTWSPTLGKALGMAVVDPERLAADGEFQVEVRGKRIEARVVELPFYRRPG